MTPSTSEKPMHRNKGAARSPQPEKARVQQWSSSAAVKQTMQKEKGERKECVNVMHQHQHINSVLTWARSEWVPHRDVSTFGTTAVFEPALVALMTAKMPSAINIRKLWEKKKKRENQQGLLFTGPEGYIAHLGTHSEVTGRELYYFCSFSVNLKLFKISLGKNALQKMLKEVIEKIWCLVRNCFLVQSQLSSHFVSIWWEKHGTTLILFYKRTSPTQRVSTCTA